MVKKLNIKETTNKSNKKLTIKESSTIIADNNKVRKSYKKISEVYADVMKELA